MEQTQTREFSFEMNLWVSGSTLAEARDKLKELIRNLYRQNKIQDYDIYN